MDDGISALPEHLQLEIFSRVADIRALFRLAATCRGWLRRFTDAAFLRELCPGGDGGSHGRHHRARLLGVFLQDKYFDRSQKAVVQARMTTMAMSAAAPSSSSAAAAAACLAPVFLPALGSPLGPAGRALTSFLGGGGADATFDYAELLAARRGMVLVRPAPRTPEEICIYHLFAVCNPVTGDRHVLPPLEWSPEPGLVGPILVGYAIITAAADDSGNGRPAARRTFSQLLVITRDQDLQRGEEADARMHFYSAVTRRWSAPATCLDRRVFTLVGGSRARSSVVHGVAAHWLCIDDGHRKPCEHKLYRLSVDVVTARVSLTRLPVRVGGQPQILFVHGELAVASVYPVHVTVWTPPGGAGDGDGQDDNDDTTAAAWPRTSFRLEPLQQHCELWWNFNHGSLLALLFRVGGGAGIFVLDVDTEVMENAVVLDFHNKGMAMRKNSPTSCVPYEMDLVEFFTLQLGGIRERLTGTTTASETE